MGLRIQRRSNAYFKGTALGIVKGQSKSGLYIDLNIENDIDEHEEIIPAFGYWAGRLPIGTKGMCCIRKPAREDKDVLVSVDSVMYEDEIAARTGIT